MKNVKYLIFIILIAAGFLYNGERFMYQADNFQSSSYCADVGFGSLPAGIEEDAIVQELLAAGVNGNVDFFMVDRKKISEYRWEITVYGTEGVFDDLANQGIYQKQYRSFFSGDVKIAYQPFSAITGLQKFDRCYFVGGEAELSAMESFKAEVLDRYGSSFLRRYGSDSLLIRDMSTIWSMIFILAFLVSLYEVIYQKKETTVRIVLGESPNGIFLKNILLDTAVYTSAFFATLLIMSRFTYASFKAEFAGIIFVLFLLANVLVNRAVFRVNLKKDLAGSSGKRTLLAANYGLKAVTMIFAVIIISTNFVTVAQGIDLYRQQDFFETHKEYSYCQLNYKIDNYLGKTNEDEDLMNIQFYERFQDQALRYIDMRGHLGFQYPIMLINENSLAEIAAEWPEFAEIKTRMSGGQSYIFLPANIKIDSYEHEMAAHMGDAFFRGQFNDYETVTYESKLALVGIKNQNDGVKSAMMAKPILLMNNPSVSAGAKTLRSSSHFDYANMYNISEEEFQHFVEEFQMTDQIAVKSNVQDMYEYNWETVSRGARISSVLNIFLIFLETGLMIFIIELEYSLNAVEIALKKIHGYTWLSRNWRIIKTTLLGTAGGTLTAVLLASAEGFKGGSKYLLGSGLLLALLELSYLVYKSHSIEKARVPAILKGEIL